MSGRTNRIPDYVTDCHVLTPPTRVLPPKKDLVVSGQLRLGEKRQDNANWRDTSVDILVTLS